MPRSPNKKRLELLLHELDFAALQALADQRKEPVATVAQRLLLRGIGQENLTANSTAVAVEQMVRRAVRQELAPLRELMAKAAFWTGTAMRLLVATLHTMGRPDALELYQTARQQAAAALREPLEDLEAIREGRPQ